MFFDSEGTPYLGDFLIGAVHPATEASDIRDLVGLARELPDRGSAMPQSVLVDRAAARR